MGLRYFYTQGEPQALGPKHSPKVPPLFAGRAFVLLHLNLYPRSLEVRSPIHWSLNPASPTTLSPRVFLCTWKAGVVHAAGVLSDGTITKQTRAKYEEAGQNCGGLVEDWAVGFA